jgi:hypothetical protein
MSEVTTENTTPEAPEAEGFSEEVEKAAKEFTALAPKVRARIRQLASKNGKGLARVAIAAVEFPYASSYPKFKNESESTLFMMMLQLNGLKGIVAKAMEPQMQEIQEEVVAKTTATIMENTTNSATPEETTNV